jgi:hypothetical protein
MVYFMENPHGNFMIFWDPYFRKPPYGLSFVNHLMRWIHTMAKSPKDFHDHPPLGVFQLTGSTNVHLKISWRWMFVTFILLNLLLLGIDPWVDFTYNIYNGGYGSDNTCVQLLSSFSNIIQVVRFPRNANVNHALHAWAQDSSGESFGTFLPHLDTQAMYMVISVFHSLWLCQNSFVKKPWPIEIARNSWFTH